MDFSKLQLFAMMKKRMAYGAERQVVLSQNISNANTPGYKPKDLKPLDFKDMAVAEGRKLAMAKTNPGHIHPGSAGTRFEVTQQKDLFEVTPTGNAVVLEDQLLKMQDNNVDYQTTTSLYRRMREIMNTAIGNR